MVRDPRDESEQPSAEVPTVAGPQPASAVAPPELVPAREAADLAGPAGVEQALSDEQQVLLAAVLNRIVPARDGLPGAGDLGVAAAIDATLAASPTLRRLFLEGLLMIELESARLAGSPDQCFGDLDADLQDDVLRAVELAWPAFFAALVSHTYRGYYTLPEVHRAIGWESRPPQPLGHRLPAFDPALLARQRQRAPFWRPTS